jgi:hypothetical protein
MAVLVARRFVLQRDRDRHLAESRQGIDEECGGNRLEESGLSFKVRLGLDGRGFGERRAVSAGERRESTTGDGSVVPVAVFFGARGSGGLTNGDTRNVVSIDSQVMR